MKWYQREILFADNGHREEVEKEKMATEGHRQVPRGYCKKMRKDEMDKELNETREELNRLTLQWKRVQQGR
jgi:hypothetical protein